MRHYGLKEKLKTLLAGALIVGMAAASGGIAFAEEEQIPVVFDPAPHGTLEFQAEVTVSKGGKTSYVPTVITADGYEWKGWSLDGTSVVDPFEVTVNKPVTFSALYVELEQNAVPQVHRAYLSLSGNGAFRPEARMNIWELAEVLMVLGVQYDRGAEDPAEVLTRGKLAEALDSCLNLEEGSESSPEAGPEARSEAGPEAGAEAGSESPSTFSDLKNHPAKAAVDRLLARGMVSGYADGTFRPDQAVTRAEAAAMINGAFNRRPDSARLAGKGSVSLTTISDVPVTHWAYAQIVEATVEHQSGEFH